MFVPNGTHVTKAKVVRLEKIRLLKRGRIKMRKMKDSGIEWIGEIPEDWEVCKIKHILSTDKDNLKVGPFGSQLSGTDFSTEGYWVYNQRTVLDYNFETNNTYVNYVKYEEMQGFQVRENDILITTRGTIGKIARVPKCFKKGILHPCIIKFRIDDTKYDYNLLEIIFNDSNLLKLQIDYESNATTIDVIYGYTLKNLVLPFPPLHEQQKITDFLDKKCSEIDSVISKTRETIEEYKKLKQTIITEVVTGKVKIENGKVCGKYDTYKDSGVEWIGEIPSEWDCFYLSQIFSPVKNKNIGKQETNLLSLSYGKIIRKNIETTFGLLPENFEGYNIIERDNIVLRLTDLQNDHKSLRVGLVTEKGIITSAYLTLKNKTNMSSNYFYYLLHSFDIAKGFYGMGAGVRQGLNWNEIRSLRIISPKESFDQQQIADFLDKKCSEIDNLITKKEQLVVELEAYKKSLIYEVVTGKRGV